MSTLRSSLAGASSYLNQVRTETGVRVVHLARTDRLMQRLQGPGRSRELDLALRAAAESSGLDFLVVALADGRVIGSSSGRAADARLPDTWVVRQAQLGVANAAYEGLEADSLLAYAEQLGPRLLAAPGRARANALVIHAAAHFPLAVDLPDAMLLGGILINRNTALIEHLREVVFPIGSLPDEAEGLAAVHLDTGAIAYSRTRLLGSTDGEAVAAPRDALDALRLAGDHWLGRTPVGGAPHVAGFASLADGEGRRIALLETAFPEAPYQRVARWLLGMVAAMLAATLLAISLVFLRSGRELSQRLEAIADTMTTVRHGHRGARVGTPTRDDELGRLARHFDELLDTIAAQDAAQRAAQQSLADEASRRRALFEHERDGVVILNPDGSVFEANPRGAAMLGYSPEEMLHIRLDQWDTRHDAAGLQALLGERGDDGAFVETVLRRRDGCIYDAEVSISRATWGERSFMLVLMRDISERKAVEAELARHRQDLEQRVALRTRELRDRTEQLDAIFALSPDGFVSFDARSRVAFVNRAFLRMTGLAAGDPIGLDEAGLAERLAQLGDAERPFPGLAALRERADEHDARTTGARRDLFSLRLPRQRVLQARLRQADAHNVSQVLYLRDVTHETEVDRMKSEFLTTAAHELRTPMTSIYGFANLLRAREMPAERRADVLDTIARQSELMIGILNQLLDLARIEARQGQDFERCRLAVADVIDATVSGYGVPAGREAPRVGDLDRSLVVSGDRQRLHQALLNVLSNAYKYSRGGGSVTLGCRRDARDRVGIAVRDQGIGMTAEQLAHVCERFYRADASGNIPGTGLGMAIVSDIVSLHGGELEFRSRPGDGTEVTIWLPLDRTRSAPAPAATAEADAAG